MLLQINFPEPERGRILETDVMRQIVTRTMAVHRESAVVLWTGRTRNGKTKTAGWMVREIDAVHQTSPRGFRAVHYKADAIHQGTGNEMKRGVRSLYHATIGTLTEGVYRNTSVEALAALTVQALRARNVQMVLVDEAGLLSRDAIHGMILVRDIARLEGVTLTLVFIGVDDLPVTMRRLPQRRAGRT